MGCPPWLPTGHALGLQHHSCHHRDPGRNHGEDCLLVGEEAEAVGGLTKEKKINRAKIVSKLNVFPYFQCGVCSAPR